MRYLAIDLGDKRTGLSVGDDITNIATPYDVIYGSTDQKRIEGIVTAIEDVGPDALVIGIPLNIDHTTNKQVMKVLNFIKELKDETDLEIFAMDEYKTSQVANQKMSQSGLTHKQKKNRRDALAATEILNRFLQRKQDEDWG